MSDLWFKNSTIAMLYAMAFLVLFFASYLYMFDFFIELLENKKLESLYGYIFGFTTFVYVLAIGMSNILNMFIKKNIFIIVVVSFLILSFIFILLKLDYLVTYLFVVSDTIKLLMMLLVASIPIYGIYSIIWEYFYNTKSFKVDIIVIVLIALVEILLLKHWVTQIPL